MSTATATKTPELSATTLDLVDKLTQAMSINKEGIITVEDNIYERLLPEDLPIATVKRLQKHNSHFLAAATEATANVALGAAAKNKDVKVVDASFNMAGKDRFDVTWTREVERNAGIPVKGQEAEKKTVYGVTNFKLTVAGAEAAAGEMKKVRERSKQAALEMFGKA